MSSAMVSVEVTTLSRIPATFVDTSVLMTEETPLPLSWIPCAASCVRAALRTSLIRLIRAGPCLVSCDASLTMGAAMRNPMRLTTANPANSVSRMASVRGMRTRCSRSCTTGPAMNAMTAPNTT
jgi:hypothetical protein